MKHFFRFLLSLCLLNGLLSVAPCEALTLNGVNYTIDTLAMYPAGPGATYYQLRLLRESDKQGRLDCWLMKVDLTNPYVHMEQVLGKDQVVGAERPSAMAVRKTTDTEIFYGGTNGDFFLTQGDVGRPTGLTVVNNEFAYIPSSSSRRLGAVGENGRAMIASNMSFAGQVVLPDTTLSISHVNYTRKENELVLYNQHNGTTTGTNAYGTELVLRLTEGEWHTNTTIRAVVTDRQVNIGDATIPEGQFILSAHGTMASAIAGVVVGDTLTVCLSLLLDNVARNVAQCIGGDNYALIVDNNQVEQTNFWNELHPRTAFGQNEDGTEVQMLVVDGRGVSVGCTTKVLGEIIHYYGAYKAVNWDGGGSSCLYIRPFGEMNKGSDGNERATGNGMFAVASVPAADNTIASIAPYQPNYSLPRYGIAAPQFLGYNQYGILVSTDVQGVTLSCDSAVGEILSDGRFLASGANGGILTATYQGGITCQLHIRLMTSAPVAIRLDSVLRDSKHPYKVEVVGTVGNNTIELLSDALSWNSLNPDIVSVNEAGEVLGVSNGYGRVVGTLGDFSDTLLVHVEIPETSSLVWDNFSAPSLWTLTSTAGFNPVLSPVEGATSAKISFSYAVGRQPFIQMARKAPLYSLPDTIRIPYTTDAELSKITVGIRTNNASTTTALTPSLTFLKNQEVVINIPVTETFGSDAAIYPLWMEYIKFTLATSTTNGEHVITLPGISLLYDAYTPENTALQKVSASSESSYVLQNGHILILRNGVLYDLLGARVK